jgi:CheY-like chemotaxis protein
MKKERIYAVPSDPVHPRLKTMNSSRDLPGTLDNLRGMRILVVEDSWQLGMAMKRLLQVLGADVAGPAATGAEAERLLSEQVPDLALVDFNLRDGELANGLIDRLHDRGVKVVVVTGYAVLPVPPGDVVAILQKPVSKELLLATLRPLIAQKVAR